MTRLVKCKKLGKLAAGLDAPSYPGELGQKIFENISKEAWQLWLRQQTMLINEYRLNTLDANARTFLKKEMENFLFGGDSAPLPAFVPEK